MLNPFVGEIVLFPFDFAPKNFAFCRGQLLPISQHAALYSLLGTTYGGDGKTTFALPDLQGKVPMAFGQAGPAEALTRTGNIAFSGTANAPPAGGGQGHENRQPYLAMNYCIALAGVFPPRT